ncbi:MAG: DUF554 domain-containing protein [Clostridia bacterium]|nr:DUF554 domain-containing protein [Clostridia bacterium]
MTSWALWGTIVNAVLVLLGALGGLLLRQCGARLRAGAPDAHQDEGKISRAIMQAMGLCVMLIGISGAIQTKNVLVVIVSMALGTLIGELFGLEHLMERFGAFVERRLGGREGSIAEGFVNATLLFCVGAMTVTGAIESAMAHTHTTYYAKGLIDMVSAAVFASTMGVGVALSAASVFVVQGLLVLVAFLAAGAIPTAITTEMIAVGSLLVLGIGTNLLGVTKLRITNMLPAMFLPILLCPLVALLPL